MQDLLSTALMLKDIATLKVGVPVAVAAKVPADVAVVEPARAITKNVDKKMTGKPVIFLSTQERNQHAKSTDKT